MLEAFGHTLSKEQFGTLWLAGGGTGALRPLKKRLGALCDSPEERAGTLEDAAGKSTD